MSNSTHSRLAPSAAKRWFNCPGSVRLVGDKTSPTSSFAEEGNVAHAIADQFLWGFDEKFNDTKDIFSVFGDSARHWVENLVGEDFDITREFIEPIEMYTDYVLYSRGLSNDIDFFGETRVDIAEDISGTVDVRLAEEFGLLQIVDLKFGQGVYVEVENNPQLMMYLLGASKLGVYTSYRIVVVQPRWRDEEDRIRVVEVTRSELAEFEVLLQERIEATKNPNAELKCGDHCQFCPVKLECPAQNEQYAVITHQSTQVTFTNERLGEILDASEALKGFLSECKDEALRRIQVGQSVPGYKEVTVWSNRRWKEGAKERLVETAADLLSTWPGMEMTESKMVSPAKAEKIKVEGKTGIKKVQKEWKSLIAQEVMKVETGTALVPDSDKREAILLVEDMFEPYEGENNAR